MADRDHYYRSAENLAKYMIEHKKKSKSCGNCGGSARTRLLPDFRIHDFDYECSTTEGALRVEESLFLHLYGRSLIAQMDELEEVRLAGDVQDFVDTAISRGLAKRWAHPASCPCCAYDADLDMLPCSSSS